MIEALALIENRRVVLNGNMTSEASHQVNKNNIVTLDGKILTPRSSRYLLLNKPIDTICSNVDEKYPSVLNLLDIDRVSELHIAGRLDANGSSLFQVYKVLLSRPISPDATQRFHQVKRMFSAIGNRVKSLHRQKIGSLQLDVDTGHWRSLTPTEVEALSAND